MDSTSFINLLADPSGGGMVDTIGIGLATYLLTLFLTKTTWGTTLFKWVDPAVFATCAGAGLSILFELAFGNMSGGSVTAIGLVAILIQRLTKWLPRVKANITPQP
ncbi:MAG: hypothetical protein Q8O19_07250 [Rectinemataceae bacterium]|nr:hypothetical protein [Rectinemataceae bacterium]